MKSLIYSLLFGLVFSTAAHAASAIDTPSYVFGENTGNAVFLQWEPVYGAQNYHLYRNGARIAATIDAYYTDETPIPGGGYFVTACNTDGVCSDPSVTARPGIAGSVQNGPETINQVAVGDDACAVPVANATVPAGVGYRQRDSGKWEIYFDEIPGMTGYLLHINGQYVAAHEEPWPFILVEFAASNVYQISAYEGMSYYEKSLPATHLAQSHTRAGSLDEAKLADDLAVCVVDYQAINTQLGVAEERIASLELETQTTTDNYDIALMRGRLSEAEVIIVDQLALIDDMQDDVSAMEIRAADDLGLIGVLETAANASESLLMSLNARVRFVESWIAVKCPNTVINDDGSITTTLEDGTTDTSFPGAFNEDEARADPRDYDIFPPSGYADDAEWLEGEQG